MQYHWEEEKLLDFGFQKIENQWIFTKDLFDNLYVKFQVQEKNLKIDVYEKGTDELFFPFYITKLEGNYISKVRNCIDLQTQEIIEKCTVKSHRRKEILSYVEEKYDTNWECPWMENPTYITLKTKNKDKWYGLIMDVPGKVLGLSTFHKVDIINLKNKPEVIEKLVNGKNILKAYHMNKKHWMSVLIDDIEMDELKAFIDESYHLVEEKK